MRINTILILGAALALLVAFPGCEPVAPPAAGHVTMRDSYFDPETLTIARGATVTWLNSGSVVHNATSGDSGVSNGLWTSPDLAPGDSFLHTFDSVATYHYYCSYHWLYGMQAWVVVTP
jgi:plastocyanin